MKAIASGAAKAIAYHVTLTYVLPVGAPLLAAYLGYVQGLPLMYIFVGSLFAFACAATGAVQFSEWLFKRSVRDKLGFAGLRIIHNARGAGLGLGVSLSSSADIPITFELVSVTTRLNNRVPAERNFAVREITMPPRGVGYFDDHIIDVVPPTPGSLEGEIDFVFRYGKEGLMKHDLQIRKQVIATFNAEGVLLGASANDVAN